MERRESRGSIEKYVRYDEGKCSAVVAIDIESNKINEVTVTHEDSPFKAPVITIMGSGNQLVNISNIIATDLESLKDIMANCQEVVDFIQQLIDEGIIPEPPK